MTKDDRAQGAPDKQDLRASLARLEARAREIPSWKMGTIVFADPRTPPPPRSVDEPKPPQT